MASRRKKPAAPAEERPSTSKVLFPVGTTYELSTGEKVEIRPWSVKMLGLMSQRIPNALEAAMSGVADLTPVISLLPTALDEVVFMVAKTIGWNETKVEEEMSADDLLGVAVAVFDVCIAGPMGKIGGLTTRIMGLMRQPIPDTTQPSSPRSSS